MKKIKVSEVVSVIRELDGKIFSLEFERKLPKCESCGKRGESFKGMSRCPHCGGIISYYAYTSARLGVVNPKNCVAPGQGKYVGVSFGESLSKGVLKYYDMQKGSYRSCVIDKINKIVASGEEYIIEK